MLENQVAQQAVALKQFGKLPSQPDVNSTEHCNAIFLEGEEPSLMHVNAITLKSGKMYESPKPKLKATNHQMPKVNEEDEGKNEIEIPKPRDEPPKAPYKEPPPYVPRVPFPQRLVKTTKLDKEFGKFVDILKRLYVHMPFVDLVSKAPLYNKFLKEILSNKRKIEEDESHPLNHECSALFSKQIPLKMKDPGRFTIPCSIGAMSFEHPLADLGASVNVMPLATYHKLGLEGMKATKMALQLADGTTRQPKGVIENVPIKVDKFYIPCDFVVMDIGNNGNASLILGCPFLATAGFKVDVGKGKLTLKIWGEKVRIERPMSEQVAILEPCDLKEQESVGFKNLEGKKVTKKDLHKLVDPDEDLSLDHYKLPSYHDRVKRKANAKTARNEKQTSPLTKAIKQVACNSSKNPD
ncbi:unnamed protein product [Rhodiola kirilowii]